MILRTQSNTTPVILLIGRRKLVFRNIKQCQKYLGISSTIVRDICFGRRYSKQYDIKFYEYKDKPLKLIEYLVKDCYVNKRIQVQDTYLLLKVFRQLCSKVVSRPNQKLAQSDIFILYNKFFFDSLKTIQILTDLELYNQLSMITADKYRSKIDFLYTTSILENIKQR